MEKKQQRTFSQLRFALVLLFFCASIGSVLFHTRAADPSWSRYRLELAPNTPESSWRTTLTRLLDFLHVRSLYVSRPMKGTTFHVTAVAYSSTVDQTDRTPCITAAGTNVRRGIIATNFLPIGTRVRIGDETYVVEDRMNEKYNGVYIIDIWHPTRKEALQFGVKHLEIEVLDSKGNVARSVSIAQQTPTPSPLLLPSSPSSSNTDTPDAEESPSPQPGLLGQVTDTFRSFQERVQSLLSARALPKDTPCLSGS